MSPLMPMRLSILAKARAHVLTFVCCCRMAVGMCTWGQGGSIYVSFNGGSTWDQQTSVVPTSGNWTAVAASGSGSRLVAVDQGGYVYTYQNGVWTQQTGAGQRPWTSVDMSGDGQVIVAGTAGKAASRCIADGRWRWLLLIVFIFYAVVFCSRFSSQVATCMPPWTGAARGRHSTPVAAMSGKMSLWRPVASRGRRYQPMVASTSTTSLLPPSHPRRTCLPLAPAC